MGHTKNYRWAYDQLAKIPYKLTYWTEFDYTCLQHINKVTRAGSSKHGKQIYNDCFIMADTETSKKIKNGRGANHVCAWSLAIRAYHRNVVCLYGTRPNDFCKCLGDILKYMPGDNTIVYFHNLSYDYVFLRRFLFDAFGLPSNQLNTKPYYPISIRFKNGLELRDSLILAQCKLEKWANDLNVEHKKAIGKWDYDKIRNQSGKFTKDELLYIQNDVLAGVECLDALCINLNKHVYSMPFTATGVPRDETRTIGKKHKARQTFNKCVPTWTEQMFLELLFHGGFTHCNRNIAGWVQNYAECRDFSSSYPTSMLLSTFPMDKFRKADYDVTIENILSSYVDYAFMFVLSVTDVELKDPFYPMPMLQSSKLLHSELKVEDNGRILKAKFASIVFNEYDLKLFLRIYKYKDIRITDVYYAAKDYLPRWFTDYIYQLFKDKSALRGVDPILYAIQKAKLNSCYGLTVQRPVRLDIKEDYETGTYYETQGDQLEAKYNKYVENFNNILPYQWGVWCTSESMFRLFELATTCIDYEHGGIWLYSDTDSVYATKWNEEKLNAYNENIKQRLIERGYPPFEINGKEFCLGVASFDGAYEEWIGLGAKRYCGRSTEDHKLHITVSGVPKAGAASLHDDIKQFRPGMVFDGITSGKKQHTYYMLEPGQEPYIDDKGNLTGDSIDLEPCDYTLDSPYDIDVKDLELYLPELTEDYE